ncbi:hypothetical protein [Nocardioides antri]|uniref:IF2 family translation initiation factor n=1 Tax=Nocardioides antri TaxID=2607659 RepID=A0A5B1LZ98_9ACTN|nr:hypothetical protein [Nocardioides antri]KAA1426003.1 hypothetical protein F0U47_16850 [Nocardioides antri]
MTSRLSSLIALPYELARMPVVLVDDRLATRLSEDSVPRVALDRVIGSADKIAGSLLHNQDIAQRGADRIERSSKLATAARLEQEATARRERAEETLVSGRQEAAQKREAARDRVTSGLAEAEAVEARGKQDAKARAAREAKAKKAASDERAAKRAATIEEREDRVESAADTKKKAAQREARSELDEARESRKSAADARADAERLSDLTKAKKQERKRD